MPQAAGITAHRDGAWAMQAARDLLMDLGQRMATVTVKFVIRDRADQFTGSFDAVFTAVGTRILASPPQAPRANAICERVIGTLRRELLDWLLIVNEQHLRRVLAEYLAHYNTARPHRSLGQLTPAQATTRPPEPDRVRADPVSQAEEFALDALVAPARVLPGQLLHQGADLVRDRWPFQRVRVGPFPRDQSPVPGQQRGWCHDPVQPPVPGQHPGQGGQHGTASPVRLWPGNLPAQHGYLMPQYQDLRVLDGVTACQEHQPAEHPER